MSALLEVSDIGVSYDGVVAVRRVDLSVSRGEAVAIVGPNGAGKTSTVHAIAGLVRPDHGSVLLDGDDVTQMPVHQRARRGIALVPSGRWLFPALSVEQNLELGRSVSGNRAHDVDSMFDSFPELRDRKRIKAGSLSGGQQQMLALARALIGRPTVLVLDEPSLGLAPLIVERLYGKLKELKDEGLAVIIVEEKTTFALDLSDRFLAMSWGQVQTSGKVTGSQVEQDMIAGSYLG